MKAKLVVIAVCALIPCAAFGQSTGEKTGVSSVLGGAPKTSDFVAEAAMSDMTEISAAKIALQKGDADEKRFAEEMIRDHTATSDQLKSLVSSANIGVTLPTQLDSASQKDVDELEAAHGLEAFKRRYDAMQIKAHKDAISLFQRYADGGDNRALKDWAQATLPKLRRHLDLAHMLDKRAS